MSRAEHEAVVKPSAGTAASNGHAQTNGRAARTAARGWSCRRRARRRHGVGGRPATHARHVAAGPEHPRCRAARAGREGILGPDAARHRRGVRRELGDGAVLLREQGGPRQGHDRLRVPRRPAGRRGGDEHGHQRRPAAPVRRRSADHQPLALVPGLLRHPALRAAQRRTSEPHGARLRLIPAHQVRLAPRRGRTGGRGAGRGTDVPAGRGGAAWRRRAYDGGRRRLGHPGGHRRRVRHAARLRSARVHAAAIAAGAARVGAAGRGPSPTDESPGRAAAWPHGPLPAAPVPQVT